MTDEPKTHVVLVTAGVTQVVQNGAGEEADLEECSVPDEEDPSDVDPAIQEKLSVYIARYSYDPWVHSPNENPDTELAFQAGDYLYVFGEVDEVSGLGPSMSRCIMGYLTFFSYVRCVRILNTT